MNWHALRAYAERKPASMITKGVFVPQSHSAPRLARVQPHQGLLCFRPALTKPFQDTSHHKGMYHDDISHAAGVNMTSEVQHAQTVRLSSLHKFIFLAHSLVCMINLRSYEHDNSGARQLSVCCLSMCSLSVVYYQAIKITTHTQT